VARAIHYESGRAEGPFVAVDCSAVPPTLVESAFYGHEKGAFTDAKKSRKGHFEMAEGGTLFLDEVGDMDTGMQAKLLRTLEERRVLRVGGTKEIPVDVRVVSATNRDLARAVGEGAFREDLYYRLNAFTIRIPPLRERPGDVIPLARVFLERYAAELRKAIHGFSSGAGDLLEAHRFPGNVRELRNLVERATLVCEGDTILPADLEFDGGGPAERAQGAHEARAAEPRTWDLRQIVQEAPPEGLRLSALEREAIGEALRREGGNQVRAAKLLGISRDALRRRVSRHNLSLGE